MGQQLPFTTNIPVFVVDDDPTVCESLVLLLRMEGFAPRAFSNAPTFLEAVQAATPACIILDLHLPGCSGLDLLRELRTLRVASPVLVISGQSDIASAVEAMKFGALDFLEKPFSAGTVINLVRDAVVDWQNSAERELGVLANFPGRQLLTGRERDVLEQVASGASNKEAGRRLGISPRTVEVHRARVMEKLGARNAADLMRIVLSDGPRVLAL